MKTIMIVTNDGLFTWVCEEQDFLDNVADAIYVHCELTPTGYDWRRQARINSRFTADYHGLEYTTISISWSDGIIFVGV